MAKRVRSPLLLSTLLTFRRFRKMQPLLLIPLRCALMIPVGTGGQANLQANHIDSRDCREAVRRASLPQKPKPVFGSLLNMFTARPRQVPATVSGPPTLSGPIIEALEPRPDEATGPDPSNNLDPDLAWLRDSPHVPARRETPSPESSESAQVLLYELRNVKELIPDYVPPAASTHPLAIFSIDPMSSSESRDVGDDWDAYLQPMLRKAFGRGELIPRTSFEYAQPGKWGLDGFCRFFEYFIDERELDGCRIGRYFQFLIEVITLRFPPRTAAAERRDAKAIAPGQLHRALPIARLDYPPTLVRYKPCFGLEIRFGEGQSPHVDYPFGLHKQFVLPWDYYSKGERFYIQAKACTQELVEQDCACRACDDLLLNDVLIGVMQRAAHGVHENTPLIYMPIGVLITVLRRRIEQCRGLKLVKLNDTRKLLGVVAQLEEHKQFVMAVGSGKVTRVAQLVMACLNNGVGIRGILERYYPGIVHRALGLPGLSTIRSNTVIRPLRASPGFPTIEEIQANIDACAEGEPESSGPPVTVHRVLMLDEIAIEQRPRWDDKTNKILGACRECSHKISLELNTEADLQEFFQAVDDDEIHLASEATVAAFGALSRDPRVYSPRPCCISGTDKHETSANHARFLRKIISAADGKNKRDNITYRTISIASDGEAKRGGSLVLLTMNQDLSEDSPIYPLLKPLDFMDLRVGDDDVTADKDYRHVLKTLRNLLMRLKGVRVLGFIITPAIIKQHLRLVGHSQEQVTSYLNPNDKQDVLLGYSLLKSLWSLPVPSPDADPGLSRARTALRTFGQLGYHLLWPYIYIELSLHEQLVHLSAAAHLLLVLYADDNAGTSFMANQTYLNLMIMIKNVYFCVAKTKIDIPDGEFFIILLGTDRLEALFGLIRTAIGTDANVDILQLASRSSNLTEVVIILANRPQWDASPRRLKLPTIINAAGEIGRNADHINPASWKGDTHVGRVTLLTSWRQGRKIAEGLIPHAAGFLRTARPEVGIFAPLGHDLIRYLDEAPPEEDFELDPDLLPFNPGGSDSDFGANIDDSCPSEELARPVVLSPDSSYTPEGDIEDALAISEPQGTFSPHMLIDGKKITKARALSGMMRYRGIRSSTDRLKRVAGLPSFSPAMHSGLMTSDSALGTPSIRIGNPVALLVSCESQLFLAVAQVNDLMLTSAHVQAIPLQQLLDSSAKVSVQILCLLPSTLADDPTEKNDWCWSLKFEAHCERLPGNLIHPLNPSVSVVNVGLPTYLFDSATLLTAAASIHGQMAPPDFASVPKVKRSDTFPYRHAGALLG
ncbi:hypothetical protein B0H15DRAFT_795200 [Mycena belliarum]|uniref:Uncharacterized protein n=1 Tax=Mycena belliarum TaxID=1033014 RepID=A0AAD6UIZ9_9AGAR|nr:hypothetical protein B0H15DRAFT_795200 [Mycena belliae]